MKIRSYFFSCYWTCTFIAGILSRERRGEGDAPAYRGPASPRSLGFYAFQSCLGEIIRPVLALIICRTDGSLNV